jgi:hypothetical protein
LRFIAIHNKTELRMGAEAIEVAFLAGFLLLLHAAAAGSPWVYSDNAPIPDGTIRITTLGSGSPDVRKEQASTAQPVWLVQLDTLLISAARAQYTSGIAVATPYTFRCACPSMLPSYCCRCFLFSVVLAVGLGVLGRGWQQAARQVHL